MKEVGSSGEAVSVGDFKTSAHNTGGTNTGASSGFPSGELGASEPRALT